MSHANPPALPAAALRPPRHRWKVLAAGVGANAAFSVAFSGLPMTAVLMRSGYQIDNATLGLVLGLMGLGIALSEVPWGLLTDRWGDRPVLLLGLVATGLVLLAMAGWAAPVAGSAPPLLVLCAGLLVIGLLGGSVNGASGRAVMSWFAEGERGLAMSVRQTAVPLGGGLGAVLLPALVQHAGFVAAYGVLGGLCLLAAGATWAWVHEPPPARGQAASAATMQPGDGPLRDRRVWRMALGIGLLCAPQFALISFGSVFLHDAGQLSLGWISGAMLGVQLGAMVMRVWSGRWTDRHANRPAYLRACGRGSLLLFALLAVLSGCMAASGLPLPRTVLAPVALLLVVACGVCVSAWHGVAYTELVTLAGAGRAGTALGMGNTLVFTVCFATPLLLPHLLTWQGWPLAWGAASLCALVATPLLSAASPGSARAETTGKNGPGSAEASTAAWPRSPNA